MTKIHTVHNEQTRACFYGLLDGEYTTPKLPILVPTESEETEVYSGIREFLDQQVRADETNNQSAFFVRVRRKLAAMIEHSRQMLDCPQTGSIPLDNLPTGIRLLLTSAVGSEYMRAVDTFALTQELVFWWKDLRATEQQDREAAAQAAAKESGKLPKHGGDEEPAPANV